MLRIGFHPLEYAFFVTINVHLVDRDNDILYAYHIDQKSVPPGLLLYSIGCRYYKDGDLSMAGAGKHVFNKLLMTGHVYYGIVIFSLPFEQDPGGINGAFFLQFFLERIKEVGKLKPFFIFLKELLNLGYSIIG